MWAPSGGGVGSGGGHGRCVRMANMLPRMRKGSRATFALDLGSNHQDTKTRRSHELQTHGARETATGRVGADGAVRPGGWVALSSATVASVATSRVLGPVRWPVGAGL